MTASSSPDSASGRPTRSARSTPAPDARRPAGRPRTAAGGRSGRRSRRTPRCRSPAGPPRTRSPAGPARRARRTTPSCRAAPRSSGSSSYGRRSGGGRRPRARLPSAVQTLIRTIDPSRARLPEQLVEQRRRGRGPSASQRRADDVVGEASSPAGPRGAARPAWSVCRTTTRQPDGDQQRQGGGHGRDDEQRAAHGGPPRRRQAAVAGRRLRPRRRPRSGRRAAVGCAPRSGRARWPATTTSSCVCTSSLVEHVLHVAPAGAGADARAACRWR